MSEDAEKQFDPTPSRLRKAKQEGDVPRASEINGNVALVCGALTTVAVVPALAALFRIALADAAARRGLSAAMSAYAPVGALTLVPAVVALLGGLAASVAQSGGFTFVAPTLKFERVDPFAGILRIFSRQTLAQGGRAMFACVVGTCAIAAGLMPLLAAALGSGSPAVLAGIAWRAALQSILTAGGVGLFFALVEYGAARGAWLRRLRMSFEEYKRAVKEQDGDAQLRGRRRSLHRAFARGDLRRVRKAAFVVCNPTHVAVALAYAPPAEPVPRVLVRAADELALRVREIALDEGIPIVEDIAVARALYADGTPGAVIPHAHYLAVAEIVAQLQRGRSPRRRKRVRA